MFSESIHQQQRLKCAFDDKGLLNPGSLSDAPTAGAELGGMHVPRGPVAISGYSEVLSC